MMKKEATPGHTPRCGDCQDGREEKWHLALGKRQIKKKKINLIISIYKLSCSCLFNKNIKIYLRLAPFSLIHFFEHLSHGFDIKRLLISFYYPLIEAHKRFFPKVCVFTF